MKKATKSGSSRMPAKKASASKKSGKPRAKEAQGQAQLLLILERLAQSTEKLAEAADRLNDAAAVLLASVTAAGEQAPERQDEMSETPGEVLGVVVVDQDEEE
jgi:hypothetical protein